MVTRKNLLSVSETNEVSIPSTLPVIAIAGAAHREDLLLSFDSRCSLSRGTDSL